MARRIPALLVLFTALAVLLAGSPANAGSLSWKDDAGDAVGLGLVDGPIHDPAFDITEVAIASAGGKLVWTAKLPDLAEGAPDLSSGYYFRFGFTHAGTDYWFITGNDLTGATNFSLAPTAAGSTAVACKDCKGTINAKEKAVTIEAPLASLDAGFKAISADPATGAEWSTLFVIAQRRMVAATLTADTADAPEGATVTL
jgi:hypothetical protein